MAEHEFNVHGVQNARGTWDRARNIHTRLSTPIHPALENVGIDVNIPDLARRFEHGNQFEVGGQINGPQIYEKKDQTRAGFSFLKMEANPHEDFGTTLDVGRVEGGLDGVGVRYDAHGLSANIALGPLDVGGKVGTAQVGAKVWEPNVGLDVGFKANASAAELNVGPVGVNVGVGIDSGMKVGKEGVGVQVLGTGIQIGRTTGISLFGSNISFKLW